MTAFSIITPSYNQAPFIRRTIESVLEQGIDDLEHIVVDGGSTDGTIDILKEYQHLTWVSEPDEGQSDAINKGFARSRGRIIGWLNSDDVYAKGALQAVQERMSGDELVVGNTVTIDQNDRILKRKPPQLSREALLHPWRIGTSIFQPGTFFTRAIFEQCGPLKVSLRCTMDYDFFLRATERFPIQHLPRDLAHFRIHRGSKTGEGWNSFRAEGLEVLLAYLSPVSEQQKQLIRLSFYLYDAVRWLDESMEAHDEGRHEEARELFERAIKRNPAVLLSYPHLCFRLRRAVGDARYEQLRDRYRSIRKS